MLLCNMFLCAVEQDKRSSCCLRGRLLGGNSRMAEFACSGLMRRSIPTYNVNDMAVLTWNNGTFSRQNLLYACIAKLLKLVFWIEKHAGLEDCPMWLLRP